MRREAFIAVSFALLLLPAAGVGAAEGPPEPSGIGDTLAW